MNYESIKFKILFFLILFFGIFGWAESSRAEIIPAERRVDWQGNVGVVGDIPADRTQCGSTINPSGQANGNSDTASISDALSSCTAGHYVKLAAGTFYINNNIYIPSNVTLRGNGIGSTNIYAVSGIGALFRLQGSMTEFETLSGVDISSGSIKGSTTIVTSSAHGLNGGDQISIDEICNPSGNPPIECYSGDGYPGRGSGADRMDGQINKVASIVNSTTFTIETPLYEDYAQSPQVAKMVAPTEYAGVEDMSIDLTNVGDYFAIQIYNANNCWLKNLELYNFSSRGAVYVYQSYRNSIRGLYFHDFTYGSSTGYGIFMSAASGNTVEDSIFSTMGAAILYNSITSGNIFAYNYFLNLLSDSSYQGGAILAHGPNPTFNLIEGNYVQSGKINFDHDWGSSTWHTVFRNKMVADGGNVCNGAACTGQVQRIVSETNNTYNNIVGNVLGDSYETAYCGGGGTKAMLYLNGCASDENLEFTSSFIHANWDSVNNSITKCNTVANPGCFGTDPDDLSLANSYYLASKPDWFGNLQWPAIGPDLNPMSGTIPAKARYEGQSYPYGSEDTTPPAAPSGLSVN